MKFFSLIFTIVFFALCIEAQIENREFPLKTGGGVEIENLYGRVSVIAEEAEEEKVIVNFQSLKSISESDVKTEAKGGKVQIIVKPENSNTRIDLIVKIPIRARVSVETRDGEVAISGNIEKASVITETGTISTDVPTDDLRYDFLWTRSRPRYLSDVKLEDEPEEKAAGKFLLNGKIGETKEEREKRKAEQKEQKKRAEAERKEAEKLAQDEKTKLENREEEKEKKETKAERRRNEKLTSKRVELNFTTGRGIILLNIPPNEVPADLSERKLTEAAKAIISSDDLLLSEAIRRANPKFFADFAKTLPASRREPTIVEKKRIAEESKSTVKQVIARVMNNTNNRAVSGLSKEDFTVFESGKEREIISIESSVAPFNLVLLLDVSGSIENYVNFIRKAARNFLNTVNKDDKVAVIIFSEDVKQISTFTTDKAEISESLDTFDAGGETAFYDALGYSLVHTLKPFKGENTAIIAMTDGDDNRSFLSFDSLISSIQESGAIIYPLYVPSSLVAAASTADANSSVDPLRTRYMGLTSKAEQEGAKLAQVSGGIYYPIQRVGDLQKAYEDIAAQLRTAYTITYKSDGRDAEGDKSSPRLRVKVNRENIFVTTGAVKDVRIISQETRKIQTVNYNYSPFANYLKNQLPDEISGDVEKINYKQFVNDKLRETKFENFNINKTQGAFLLDNGKEKIAVSRWISPKRTRSYPYERVYDTLAHNGKKAAIIPVVKDEGLEGERDFLQWDTISLLSLLDVRVILAYYDSAEKNVKRRDQITAQKFDENYINSRLKEVFDFEGTSHEWNEREIKQLKNVFEKAKLSYQKISKETQTYLHDSSALDELIKYAETPQNFLEFSRRKSRKAQGREFVTDQPKEALSTDTKAKVMINNALFGKYFFTCDETKIENNVVYLIEAKHSIRGKMPSKNDIKDGFVKMMLYTNLTNIKVGAKDFNAKAQIRLTANQLKGSINSAAKDEEITKFLAENSLDFANANFIKEIIEEARANNFTVILEHGETSQK